MKKARSAVAGGIAEEIEEIAALLKSKRELAPRDAFNAKLQHVSTTGVHAVSSHPKLSSGTSP